MFNFCLILFRLMLMQWNAIRILIASFFLNAYIVFKMNVVHLNLQQDLINFVWTKEPDNIPIGHWGFN